MRARALPSTDARARAPCPNSLLPLARPLAGVPLAPHGACTPSPRRVGRAVLVALSLLPSPHTDRRRGHRLLRHHARRHLVLRRAHEVARVRRHRRVHRRRVRRHHAVGHRLAGHRLRHRRHAGLRRHARMAGVPHLHNDGARRTVRQHIHASSAYAATGRAGPYGGGEQRRRRGWRTPARLCACGGLKLPRHRRGRFSGRAGRVEQR